MNTLDISGQVIIKRPFVDTDSDLVFATWLSGVRFSHPWFRRINSDIFSKNYGDMIRKYLSNSTTVVAVFQDDPDVVLGYCCYKGHAIHWIYVKMAWRDCGIAKFLLPPEINTYTHLSKVGRKLVPDEWEFNPFII